MAFVGLLSPARAEVPQTETDYNGSSYNAISAAVFTKPYDQLPQYSTTATLFGDSGSDPAKNHLLSAAQRTLSDRRDLIEFPQGQKLLQANGICFAGKWIIDQPSDYSGQFRFPTESLLIARASVLLSGTQQGDKRGFGLALKIFPTGDPDQIVPTLNAFVMHSMGGIKTKYTLDLVVDNEPPLGALPPLRDLSTAYRLMRDFKRADNAVSHGGANISYRPLTHLAEQAEIANINAPTWLRLKALDTLPRIDQLDFRDELRTQHYPEGTLVWVIEAATDAGKGKSRASWSTLGRVVFNNSITSVDCDQRLHFVHPVLHPARP